MPLSIDKHTIARVQVVAWEDGEWGVVWETRDGRRGSERIGKRSDAEAIVLAVIGGDFNQPAGMAKAPRRASIVAEGVGSRRGLHNINADQSNDLLPRPKA